MKFSHLLAPMLASLAALFFAGCAGHYGLLSVEQGGGARPFVRVESFGPALEVGKGVAALSLGWQRVRHMRPGDPAKPAETRARRFAFYAPVPASEVIGTIRQRAGLHVGTDGLFFGHSASVVLWMPVNSPFGVRMQATRDGSGSLERVLLPPSSTPSSPRPSITTTQP